MCNFLCFRQVFSKPLGLLLYVWRIRGYRARCSAVEIKRSSVFRFRCEASHKKQEATTHPEEIFLHKNQRAVVLLLMNFHH